MCWSSGWLYRSLASSMPGDSWRALGWPQSTAHKLLRCETVIRVYLRKYYSLFFAALLAPPSLDVDI